MWAGRQIGCWQVGGLEGMLVVRFEGWSVGLQIGRSAGRFRLTGLHMNSLAGGKIVKYNKSDSC